MPESELTWRPPEAAILLSWHAKLWQQDFLPRCQSAWPQALCLAGPVGGGVLHLAAFMAAWRLCAQPKTDACGTCRSCLLLKSGTHPDLMWLRPESPTQVIRVDAVRTLLATIAHSAQVSKHRVVVITQADRMHPSAANALLKCLEDPPQGVSFILQAERKAHLLPTILSRLQWWPCPNPKIEQSMAWLTTQGHSQADADRALKWAKNQPLVADAWLQDKTIAHYERCLNALLARRPGEGLSAALQDSLEPLALPDILMLLQRILADWCLLSLGLAPRLLPQTDKAMAANQASSAFFQACQTALQHILKLQIELKHGAQPSRPLLLHWLFQQLPG